MDSEIRYVDLFSGMGGFRVGIEEACARSEVRAECVLSSEIKESAITTYEHNFGGDELVGDIRAVDAADIPDFDLLAAGFPCQAFSAAGKRDGFLDTRGTLFFEIERILSEKRPYAFVLENVPGLVNHDKNDRSDDIGQTLTTILGTLDAMGYDVSWAVKNATNFGLAQNRDRVFITGTLDTGVDIDGLGDGNATPRFADVQQRGCETLETELAAKLLENFEPGQLHGKAIKDTRGGPNNIHSWELKIRGETNAFQRRILSELLRQRRRKKWARNKGIKWMDGMPLTPDEIRSFMKDEEMDVYTAQEFADRLDGIESELEDLASKTYLSHQYPKDLVEVETDDGKTKTVRKHDASCEKGYDIATGNLSFGIRKILDPANTTPTLVATDVDRIAVVDEGGLRKLTPREGLRLSGFSEKYELPVSETAAYDLIGNTVPVPIVRAITTALIAETQLGD